MGEFVANVAYMAAFGFACGGGCALGVIYILKRWGGLDETRRRDSGPDRPPGGRVVRRGPARDPFAGDGRGVAYLVETDGDIRA